MIALTDNGKITTLALATIILLIVSTYNRIKYLCLEKACQRIVEAESHTELSGEEKFNLVKGWIQESLPTIFTISLFQSVLEKLIQYAYDNSFEYMSKYIKRKTGLDLSEVITEVKNMSKEDTNNASSNES